MPRIPPDFIKTTRWNEAGTELARRQPHYAQGGQPNWFHLCGAALNLGFTEINDDNLDTVIARLEGYAIARVAEIARNKARREKRKFTPSGRITAKMRAINEGSPAEPEARVFVPFEPDQANPLPWASEESLL